MIELDRRSLLTGVAATGVAFSVPAMAGSGERAAWLFVADARFEASLAAAMDSRRSGAVVIDNREQDLGVVWNGRIPKLLENGGGIEGLTLWSDLVICETFGRGYGLRLLAPPQVVVSPPHARLQHWKLG